MPCRLLFLILYSPVATSAAVGLSGRLAPAAAKNWPRIQPLVFPPVGGGPGAYCAKALVTSAMPGTERSVHGAIFEAMIMPSAFGSLGRLDSASRSAVPKIGL